MGLVQTFLKLNDTLTYTIIQFLKSLHKSNSFKCESTSKFNKFNRSLNDNKQGKKLLFLEILLTFSVFIIFMFFQLILPVLLTTTNFCFQDQVTPPSDRLLVVNQNFTKLDMVYSIFFWSQPDMVSVSVLDSQKYGHHQFYLYIPASLFEYFYMYSSISM